MAELSWGKPKLVARKITGKNTYGSFINFYTPVESSTQLTTTKGTKTEAKIEGGENEAVRYARSTYALAFTIRGAKDRKKPIADSDGLVTGEYQLFLAAEDETCPGLVMLRATVSVEEAYTAADGITWIYTFDAVKPTDGKDQVRWGTVAITQDGTGEFVAGESKIKSISFTEYGEGDETDATAVTYGTETAK
jgi:hypothetical protein